MTTSVIIPAYNEAPTLGAVVRASRQAAGVREVIVVDDGSSDETALAGRWAGAHRVLRLPRNRGKGAAVRMGAEVAGGECLLLLDGDLRGLAPAHPTSLIEPVRRGVAHMTLGVLARGRISTDLAQAMTPWLSGQRAVLRSALDHLDDLGGTSFTLEVALNRWCRRARGTVQTVELPGVTHRWKEEKLGFVAGAAARMRMYWEIVRYSARSA